MARPTREQPEVCRHHHRHRRRRRRRWGRRRQPRMARGRHRHDARPRTRQPPRRLTARVATTPPMTPNPRSASSFFVLRSSCCMRFPDAHDGFVGTLQGIEGDEEDVVGSDKVPTVHHHDHRPRVHTIGAAPIQPSTTVRVCVCPCVMCRTKTARAGWGGRCPSSSSAKRTTRKPTYSPYAVSSDLSVCDVGVCGACVCAVRACVRCVRVRLCHVDGVHSSFRGRT